MCNTKDLAVTKIEKLTAAMHRLAAAMEGHVAKERHDEPTEAPVHSAACSGGASAGACASEVGNGGGVLSTFFDGEDLDPGILPLVIVLRDAGMETYESCQGGEGHAYPEPTIRFHGDRSEGHKALAAADLDRHRRRGHRTLLGDRLQAYLRRAHSAQSGLPPVPCRRFSFSMLLPTLQSVLS